MTIVKKETRATAISLGHPIPVTRNAADFAALYVARAWLGEHRASMSHLYDRIREMRGLNYGDYAYIEHFNRPGAQFFPSPGIARRNQLFEIWIRPVVPENAQMAMRIALYETQKFIDNGLSQEDFDKARDYLMKNVYLLTANQNQRLGYALDSWWYGMGDYVDTMRAAYAKLTRDDVNRAIKKYLSAKNLQVVIIAKDAEGLRSTLLADGPSSIKYDAPKPRPRGRGQGDRQLQAEPQAREREDRERGRRVREVIMECGGDASAFLFARRKPQPSRTCRANSKAAALPPHSKLPQLVQQGTHFPCVPCIVLGHHLHDPRDRHPPHPVLLSHALYLLRGEPLDPLDVARPGVLKLCQRRLEVQFPIPPLLRDDVSLEVRQLRIILGQHLLDTQAVALRLQVREVPRLLDEGKRPVRRALPQTRMRCGREKRAKLGREGAEFVDHRGTV